MGVRTSGRRRLSQTILYRAASVAASQTDVSVPLIGGANNNAAPVAKGSVVGIAVIRNAGAVPTAGSATFEVSVNNVQKSLNTVIDATNNTSNAATVGSDVIPVAGGDAISVEVTTDASWNGTTGAYVVAVVIELQL